MSTPFTSSHSASESSASKHGTRSHTLVQVGAMSALGELDDQRSHTLTRATEPDTITSDVYNGADLEALLARDFTDRIVFSGIAMASDRSKPRVLHSPVAVVYTRDQIIDGHNGIFKDEFRTFLGKYIAFIEGKSLAARFVARSKEVENFREEHATSAPEQ